MTEKTLTTGSWARGPIEFPHLELGRETGLSPRVVGVIVTPGQCQHQGAKLGFGKPQSGRRCWEQKASQRHRKPVRHFQRPRGLSSAQRMLAADSPRKQPVFNPHTRHGQAVHHLCVTSPRSTRIAFRPCSKYRWPGSKSQAVISSWCDLGPARDRLGASIPVG